MFYHIEGTVAELEPNMAVIDCAGVGYALNASANTISCLKKGARSKLFVAESITENAFDLFGFYTKSEKRCFEMLTAVSGIGPKAAISILSYNTPESLALAIMNSDEKALTVAPGIGKKIAQRVILELKDKISKEMGGQTIDIRIPASASASNSSMNDALAGLAVLGYSSSDIASALKTLETADMTAEQIIKAVLKKMVK
ncbi:MAG: Holliday junction branch migration protein RuvA [Eubacteriales bacterium]|nr:Holliday junction branch migration protein RuvA [Eubacteriales bacterium]